MMEIDIDHSHYGLTRLIDTGPLLRILFPPLEIFTFRPKYRNPGLLTSQLSNQRRRDDSIYMRPLLPSLPPLPSFNYGLRYT